MGDFYPYLPPVYDSMFNGIWLGASHVIATLKLSCPAGLRRNRYRLSTPKPKPKDYPMNKITLPFLHFGSQVNKPILQAIIDKNSHIDVIGLDDDHSKRIFIYLKIKTIEKNKWVQPIGVTTIVTIDNTEYIYLGFLMEHNFEKESDIIRNFITTQKKSIITGKLVPVPEDKLGDFYFEWLE
jgi:hypothetical protein